MPEETQQNNQVNTIAPGSSESDQPVEFTPSQSQSPSPLPRQQVTPEMQKLQNAIRELQKFQLAVEAASDQIMILDSKGIVIYINKACQDVSGYAQTDFVGKDTYDMWGRFLPGEEFDELWDTIKNKQKTYVGEVHKIKKDGSKYITNTRISPITEGNNVLFFVAIEQDVTKSKEVDRMKTEFVSIASHQLRTPLSAIKLNLALLMDGSFGQVTPEQFDYLKKLDQSNERMIELIDLLLNVSKIESGRLVLKPEPFNLSEILDSVLEELYLKMEKKNLHVDINIAQDVPQVILDKKLTRHVVINLISNAVKYTNPTGRIQISIYKQDDNIVVKVEDSGVGIPEIAKSKIFQKFFRADNVKAMETDGTGLGLYLVKIAVDSWGGDVWFESKESEGSSFFFTVPLHRVVKENDGLSLGA